MAKPKKVAISKRINRLRLLKHRHRPKEERMVMLAKEATVEVRMTISSIRDNLWRTRPKRLLRKKLRSILTINEKFINNSLKGLKRRRSF